MILTLKWTILINVLVLNCIKISKALYSLYQWSKASSTLKIYCRCSLKHKTFYRVPAELLNLFGQKDFDSFSITAALTMVPAAKFILYGLFQICYVYNAIFK